MRKQVFKKFNRNNKTNENIWSLLIERIKNRVKIKTFLTIVKGLLKIKDLLKNNQRMMALFRKCIKIRGTSSFCLRENAERKLTVNYRTKNNLKMNQQITIFLFLIERLLSNRIKHLGTGKKSRTFLTFSFSLKGLLTRFCVWKLVRKGSTFSFSLIFKKLVHELRRVFYLCKVLIGIILFHSMEKEKLLAQNLLFIGTLIVHSLEKKKTIAQCILLVLFPLSAALERVLFFLGK